MLGIKQEAFAAELGEDRSQGRISLLEQKEEIQDGILEEVAKVLRVPVEAIKNFDEEKAINVISNTFHKKAFIYNTGTININPLDKWLETLEENKRLNEENKNLFERLLQSEKDKLEILEKMLKQIMKNSRNVPGSGASQQPQQASEVAMDD